MEASLAHKVKTNPLPVNDTWETVEILPTNLKKDTTHVVVHMLEDVVFENDGADGPLLLEKNFAYELYVETCGGTMTPNFYVPSQSKHPARKGVEIIVPTGSFVIIAERDPREHPPVIEDWSKGFKR